MQNLQFRETTGRISCEKAYRGGGECPAKNARKEAARLPFEVRLIDRRKTFLLSKKLPSQPEEKTLNREHPLKKVPNQKSPKENG